MIRKKLHRCIILLRNVLCVAVTLFIILIYHGARMKTDLLSSLIPSSAFKFYLFDDKELKPSKHPTEIQGLINDINFKERILNSDIFGPIETDRYCDSCCTRS